MSIYFDNAATTVPSDTALKAAQKALGFYGNPSSPHFPGVEARRELEAARKQLAAVLGFAAEELYFTASGSESNNTAIFGIAEAQKRRSKTVVSTDSEHPSVDEPLKRLESEGFEVIRLSTKGGSIDLDELKEALTRPVALVSVMQVNNETGAINDLCAIRAVINASRSGALLHSDAVQGLLKFKGFRQGYRACDAVSFSAHKIHGLRGAGALAVRKGVRVLPRILGGGQEKGLRSGTENLAAICAFAAAATDYAQSLDKNLEKIARLRSFITEQLSTADFVRFNLPQNGCDGILNLSLLGQKSETLLNALSMKGIYVSASSACSSKKAENRVLKAFGLPKEQTESALRIGISHTNSEEEAKALCNELLSFCRGSLKK